MALGDCVADVESFLRQTWGRRPEVVYEGSPIYSSLIDLDAIDELVTTRGLRFPAFRMVREGEVIDPATYTKEAVIGQSLVNDLIEPGKVVQLLEDGATLVLQGLHRFWEPVAAFANQLALDLGHPVQTNAYITPGNSRGFDIHYDTHDVFVLQCIGRKRWEVFGEVQPRALPGEKRKLTEEEVGSATLGRMLEQGDVLYIPRGWAHAARTVGEPSVHLTMGVLISTWLDALQVVWSELEGRSFLRGTVPTPMDEDFASGWNQVRAEILDQLASTDMIDVKGRLLDRIRTQQSVLTRGVVGETLTEREILNEETFRLKPASIVDVLKEEDHLVLVALDRTLSLPASYAEAIAFVMEGHSFDIEDLSRFASPQDAALLITRLIREGLVDRLDAGSPQA